MSDEFTLFDPLGIDPTPEPEEQDEPEVPEELQVLSEENFAPDIPEPSEPANVIVPAEHAESELGHYSLAEANVPVKNKLVLAKPNIPANVSKEQKKLVERAVRDVTLHGARAAAMICKGTGDIRGDACPYLQKCPLYRYKVDLPVGDECPVEMAALTTWVQGYMRELEVNPHDVSSAYEVQIAGIMAGLNLQIHRARWGEALNPLLEQTITNIGPGEIMNEIKVGNYNTDYRDKAIRQLQKLGRDNMQTRERQVSLMRSGYKDASKHSAEVHERLLALEKKAVSVEETVEIDKDNLVTRLSRIKYYESSEEKNDEDRSEP